MSAATDESAYDRVYGQVDEVGNIQKENNIRILQSYWELWFEFFFTSFLIPFAFFWLDESRRHRHRLTHHSNWS